MNMDNYAAEYYLKNQFAEEGRPKDFLRVQKYATKIPMDDISKSNLDLLEKTGSDLYDEEKVAIELFMKTILDEKYGAKWYSHWNLKDCRSIISSNWFWLSK